MLNIKILKLNLIEKNNPKLIENSASDRRYVTLDTSCIYRKQSGIWVMWADRLVFSHSERIWPGIGPRLVGGPKKSPRVITVLILRPRYRFLPRYHPSLVDPHRLVGPWPTNAHLLPPTISLSHFLSYFLFLNACYANPFSISISMSTLVIYRMKDKI